MSDLVGTQIVGFLTHRLKYEIHFLDFIIGYIQEPIISPRRLYAPVIFSMIFFTILT